MRGHMLLSGYITYALWKEKHFTELNANKNFAFQSRIKDHFCSLKKILLLICFIEGKHTKHKTCCFLAYSFI